MPIVATRFGPEPLEAFAITCLHHDRGAGGFAATLRPSQPHQMTFESALHKAGVMLIATAELRAVLLQMKIAVLRAAVCARHVLQRRVGQGFSEHMKAHDLAIIGIAAIALYDEFDP